MSFVPIGNVPLFSTAAHSFFPVAAPQGVPRPVEHDRYIYACMVKTNSVQNHAALKVIVDCYHFLHRYCVAGTMFVTDIPNGIIVKRLRRIPVRVVVRYAAHGSYLDRHPGTTPGEIFCEPELEYFLDLGENGHSVPYFDFKAKRELHLFNGKTPLSAAPNRVVPFETIVPDEMKPDALWEDFFPSKPENAFSGIPQTALRVANCFAKAWKECGAFLVNMEMSFGVDGLGNFHLMSFWKPSSWRLWPALDQEAKESSPRVYADKLGRPLQHLASVLKSNGRWVPEQVAKFPTKEFIDRYKA